MWSPWIALTLKLLGASVSGCSVRMAPARRRPSRSARGLTVPDAGTVELLGLNWHTGANELRQRIGIQLQETQFPDKLTVEETLRLFRSFYRRGISVEESIQTAQLEEKRSSRVGRTFRRAEAAAGDGLRIGGRS